MCHGGAWEAGSATGGVTHFREMCHRRPFGWKCVAGREKECALEGPGREVRGGTALRTSTKSATEGRLDGSALQGGRRNAPWRGLEGRFEAARRYALSRKAPQKVDLAEVRCRAGEEICLGGAWKGTSGQHDVTHFHEKCHRKPFGWKCVAGREKECALEGPGREVRGSTALHTSTKSVTEGRSGRSALQGGRRNVPRRGLERHFGAARRYHTSTKSATEGRSGGSALQGGRRNVPRRGLGGRSAGSAHRYKRREAPRMRAPGTRQDRITAFSVLAGDSSSSPGPDSRLFGLHRRLQGILENKNKRIRTLICPSGHLSEQKKAKVFADLPLHNQKRS